MAHKTLKLTEAGVGRYRTRMLKAGDDMLLDGPRARLFTRMGWAEEATDTTRPAAPPTVAKQAPRAQLDHDGDGKAGGSKRGAQSTRAKGKARKAKSAK